MLFLQKGKLSWQTFLHENKLYMVKGVNDNLDNIISYRVLPLSVRTTIIPFMGCLIYDGILGEYPIDFGPGLNETIERDYNELEKIYYL